MSSTSILRQEFQKNQQTYEDLFTQVEKTYKSLSLSPIHSGIIAHIRTNMTRAGTQTCALAWERRWDLLPKPEICSHRKSNPGSEEPYQSHLTSPGCSDLNNIAHATKIAGKNKQNCITSDARYILKFRWFTTDKFRNYACFGLFLEKCNFSDLFCRDTPSTTLGMCMLPILHCSPACHTTFNIPPTLLICCRRIQMHWHGPIRLRSTMPSSVEMGPWSLTGGCRIAELLAVT